MNGTHTVNMGNKEQYILRDKIDSDLSQIPLMTDAEIAVMHRYHAWLSMWERIEWVKRNKILWGEVTPLMNLVEQKPTVPDETERTEMFWREYNNQRNKT